MAFFNCGETAGLRSTGGALTVGLLLLVCTAPAVAGGYGLSYGGANERWVKDSRFGETHHRHDINYNFVLDPFFDSHHRNSSQTKIMGYRLVVGNEASYSDEYGGITLQGTSVVQNFAFRLTQTDVFRHWLGPQLRLVRYEVNERSNGQHYTGGAFGGSVGVATGFDILPPGQVGISLSFGVRRSSYWGTVHATDANGYYYNNAVDIDHRANAVFADVAVIFLSR